MTIRTYDELVGLFPDNSSAQINPVDMRDFLDTARDWRKLRPKSAFVSGGGLTLNMDRGSRVFEVVLTANVTSLSFTNVPSVNLIYPSNEITNSGLLWGANGTRTANATTDPWGTTTAGRLVLPASSGTYLGWGFRPFAGVTYCFSFWAREAASGSLFNLGFDDVGTDGLSLASSNQAPTGSWVRYFTSWTADATAFRYAMVDNRLNTVSADMYVAGFMVNVGSTPDDYLGTTDGMVGEVAQARIVFRQDGTGGREVTWPSNIIFEGGDPTLSNTPNGFDVVDLMSYDGGGFWIGSHTIKEPV